MEWQIGYFFLLLSLVQLFDIKMAFQFLQLIKSNQLLTEQQFRLFSNVSFGHYNMETDRKCFAVAAQIAFIARMQAKIYIH